jgi:HTH-type transcriptional regulator/antitoxin HipB
MARSPSDVGHALREARKTQKLTQKELASRSGVWQETISKIENGHPGAKLETIFDLCAALKLEMVFSERNSPANIEDIF